MLFLNLLIILLLLFANAFFVASEFSLVSVRETRMQQLANEGDSTAKLATEALNTLDKYIAATQLGITIASIGLGWVGEATLAKLIHPLFDFLPNMSETVATHSIATCIAFVLITFMHVVIGELMPKSIALQFPEKTTLTVMRPLAMTATILHPFIFLLNGFGNFMLKLIHITPATSHHSVHSEEELDMIIEESYKGGVLNETENFLLKNSLKFTDLTAKQIMIPRCNVITIPEDINNDDFTKIIFENQFSRYPVYADTFDNIVGILHIKDFYSCNLKNQDIQIKDILRKPLLVPETMTLDNLLKNFKSNTTEIAIVVDEFGGMSGIVSLEDVLEEIFGDVQDEFDNEEVAIKKVDDNKYIIDGLYRIPDLFEEFGIKQEEDEDVDTIGGLIQKSLSRLPKMNDEIKIDNIKVRVIEMRDRRISKVLLIKEEEPKTQDSKES